MITSLNPIFVVGPRIDRKNLNIKHAKVGQTVLIDVDVEGEPMPTTMWTLLGNEVKAEGNMFLVASLPLNILILEFRCPADWHRIIKSAIIMCNGMI